MPTLEVCGRLVFPRLTSGENGHDATLVGSDKPLNPLDHLSLNPTQGPVTDMLCLPGRIIIAFFEDVL